MACRFAFRTDMCKSTVGSWTPVRTIDIITNLFAVIIKTRSSVTISEGIRALFSVRVGSVCCKCKGQNGVVCSTELHNLHVVTCTPDDINEIMSRSRFSLRVDIGRGMMKVLLREKQS